MRPLRQPPPPPVLPHDPRVLVQLARRARARIEQLLSWALSTSLGIEPEEKKQEHEQHRD